jgi:uncharacterized membrane protein YfcA
MPFDITLILPAIPADVDPFYYYLFVGAGVLITAIAKAGFGGGIGILALPLMAAVMPPQHMLGIMLPVLIAADVLSNLHYLREYEWRLLRWLLPGAVSGVIAGTVIFMMLRGTDIGTFNYALAIIIGSVCLLVVLMQVYRLTGRELPTLPSHPASSFGIGLVAGTVSTISHSAGPIVSIYLLQEKVPKRRLMGTILLYFLLINSAKVPSFVAMGLINQRTLLDSIWFIPLLPIGTLAGAWMNKRIPEKPFAAVMYVAAAAAAAHMIYKALV